MKVAVVTPTIGSEHFTQCIESVQNQTYTNLVHYVFIDGENHFDKVLAQGVKKDQKYPIKSIGMQENVGHGWYGHRVYAACSFLVNADIICYLDEDNWYEPNHVANLVKVIESGNAWAYSLRKIYDKQGNFVCEDNCESLGKWPVFFDEKINHIDTSSFAIRRDVAVQIGHAWYGKWGADRQFYSALKQYFPQYDCTNDNTLCYRLDGNANSVNKDFFEHGNAETLKLYNGEYPWKNKNRNIQIAPGITIVP